MVAVDVPHAEIDELQMLDNFDGNEEDDGDPEVGEQLVGEIDEA